VDRAFGLSGIIQKFIAQGIFETRHFGAPKPRSLKNQSFNSGAPKKGRDDNKLPHGNGVNITSRVPRCGRIESAPRAVPLRHWKEILSRTIVGFSKYRIASVAAGVTFYTILAIFPGIAAMISLYGLFADTGSISSQLSNLSGIQPGDAAEIIRGELTHLVAQKTSSLATGFFIGIGIALWSASGGVMALIDALNVVYDEEEKRSFVKRAAIALLFTAGSIVFLLIALGAVIVLPIVLNFVGFWGLSDIVMRIIRCQSHTLVVLSLVYLGGLRWPFLISDGQ